MRILLFLLTICFSPFVFTQDDLTEKYFVQATIHFENASDYGNLQALYAADEHFEVVRVDPHSGRIFLLTVPLSSFTAEELELISQSYFETLNCIVIGRKGRDRISESNYANCE